MEWLVIGLLTACGLFVLSGAILHSGVKANNKSTAVTVVIVLIISSSILFCSIITAFNWNLGVITTPCYIENGVYKVHGVVEIEKDNKVLVLENEETRFAVMVSDDIESTTSFITIKNGKVEVYEPIQVLEIPKENPKPQNE